MDIWIYGVHIILQMYLNTDVPNRDVPNTEVSSLHALNCPLSLHTHTPTHTP